MKKISVLLVFASLFLTQVSFAQCDSIAKACADNITEEYISDGQQYRALLEVGQTADFRMTLFGGFTYRFAGCSRLEARNLIFRVYDQEHNEIFSNKGYDNATYWDFEVMSTLDCVVEAELDANYTQSGCAVLLIGFKP